MRIFTRMELAFFSVQRRWVPEIVARFGDDQSVRDAIMHFDSDGGLGFLTWIAKESSWVLTSRGRRWVGDRACILAARWEPTGQEKIRYDKLVARMIREAEEEWSTDPRGSVPKKRGPKPWREYERQLEREDEEEEPCDEESS